MDEFIACLDPGHGGQDSQNRGPTGYVEKDGTLKIALHVVEYLKPYSAIRPILTRWEDKTLTLQERAKIANDAKADILVSIHSNANGDKTIRGTETYHSVYSHDGKGGQRLAVLVHCHVIAAAGTIDHGIRSKTGNHGDYYGMPIPEMIRLPEMPSIIVECAYHSNPEDEALLKTEGFRRKCALGIVRGIVAYAGLDLREPYEREQDAEIATLKAKLAGIWELAKP